MPDVFTREKRSKVMARIKGKGNKDTELAMIHVMKSNHITGWRRNHDLFGKPDFVFPKQRVALFVDGCFWHKCPKHFKMPESNREFWERKLNGNKIRDKLVNKTLKVAGWKVIRIWEHELADSNTVTKRVLAALQSSDSPPDR